MREVARTEARRDLQPMVPVAVVHRIEWLRPLNAAATREIASRALVRRFARGEVLWRTGAQPRGLFIVVEGEVRITRSLEGRQHVLHTEGAGGTLGEIPLFGGGGYPATAAAVTAVSCLVLTHDGITAAIGRDPTLATILLGRLAHRVRDLIDRLDRATTQSVPSRLAAYLLSRPTRNGVLTVGCSQQELAEELGTVREVVVRALRRLRTAGLIRGAGRGRLLVLDSAGLRDLAVSPHP